MQKYPYISIFVSKEGKFIVQRAKFRNQIEKCTVFCVGLILANENNFKLIQREEEGTEKIELIFNKTRNAIELESTLNKINTIYVLSELIKVLINRLLQKETQNIRLAFWAESKEISIINYENIDIATICAVTAGAIQKVAERHFYNVIKENDIAIIELQTNHKDEILIASTEEQERTLTILIESLLNAIKIII